MRAIKFSKMVASGNDFIVIDRAVYSLQLKAYSLRELALKLCNRKFSIGADGLLVIERSKRADFRMRIFNPDGSEPSMCGNGARCVAMYAFENKIAPKEMVFETSAGNIEAAVRGGRVKIKMTQPKKIGQNVAVNVNDKKFTVHFINTGVPHAVYFVQNLDEIDVVGLGRAIRYHDKFAPLGTNVNFVKIEDKDKIKIRTYERGVEDETLACGTGAVASAIIASIVRDVVSPTYVRTEGGEVLTVYFNCHNDKFKDVYLEGDVREVFTGEVKDGI